MRAIRIVVVGVLCLAAFSTTGPSLQREGPTHGEYKHHQTVEMTEAKFENWLFHWERNITGSIGNRYCDKDTGADMGWLMLLFLKGFYYGYIST